MELQELNELKGRKQLIQESLHTFVTATSVLLINYSIQAQCLIKSIQIQ